MRERLQLKDWTLYYLREGAWSGEELNSSALLEKSGAARAAVRVPCDFEQVLMREGVLPDLYYSDNVWAAQEWESAHQWYCIRFDRPAFAEAEVLFEGIDTLADVYCNGQLLGRAENMFRTYAFALPALAERGNELVVHIRPVLRAEGLGAGSRALEHGYAYLSVRKCASSFGWDILPRLCCGGLWKGVFLQERPACALEEAYLYTLTADAAKAELVLWYAFRCAGAPQGYTVRAEGVCGDSRFSVSAKAWSTAGNVRICVPAPALWYPRGAGEPRLYSVTVTLYKDGRAADSRTFRTGIRTAKLVRTSLAVPEGKFEFRINGKKVFVLGTNWVPTDALHTQMPARTGRALALAEELGCNLVRVWGGGVYESDTFYDYCDEHGILVWQDFMMACGVYPQDGAFCENLRIEAEQQVKRLRGHASLVLWAGDNECDFAGRWGGRWPDLNGNRLTREVLPAVLRAHDPERDYLPSSPYIDGEGYRFPDLLSEEHLWGPRDYFKGDYYRNAACLFASEIGYHGCPSPASLRAFLAAPERMFEADGTPAREYLAHAAAPDADPNGSFAYRIGLMAQQVKTLFGSVPKEINVFAKCSQISQAEALKYFIERFRLRMDTHGGIVWWNLIDGWPQVSDAVVDYYFCKKLAYPFIRRSQQPVCMMMEEDGRLFAVNDTDGAVRIAYTVRELYAEAEKARGKAELAPRSVTALPYAADVAAGGFYLFAWEGDACGRNHFCADLPHLEFERYCAALRRAGMDEFEGF